MAYDPNAGSRNVDIEQQEVGASAERHVPAVRMPAWRAALDIQARRHLSH